MATVYILTIRDGSDFDRVVHESVHASYKAASDYETSFAMPLAQSRLLPEWKNSLRADIRAIRYHA